MAISLQMRDKFALEFQDEESILAARDAGPRSAFEHQLLARAWRTAGAQLHQCAIRIEHPLQQHFDPGAAFLGSEQARREHRGVVHDHQVAGLKQPRKVGELPVVEAARPRKMQEPACAPLLEGLLRNQFLGRVVGEVLRPHPRIVGKARVRLFRATNPVQLATLGRPAREEP